jgi:hypothetical protein
MAGAVALLRYVANIEGRDKSGGDWPDLIEDGDDDGKWRCWEFFMHRNLASALEKIAMQTVVVS